MSWTPSGSALLIAGLLACGPDSAAPDRASSEPAVPSAPVAPANDEPLLTATDLVASARARAAEALDAAIVRAAADLGAEGLTPSGDAHVLETRATGDVEIARELAPGCYTVLAVLGSSPPNAALHVLSGTGEIAPAAGRETTARGADAAWRRGWEGARVDFCTAATGTFRWVLEVPRSDAAGVPFALQLYVAPPRGAWSDLHAGRALTARVVACHGTECPYGCVVGDAAAIVAAHTPTPFARARVEAGLDAADCVALAAALHD